MSKGQDVYEERKRLQNENSLLQEEKNNRRLKEEKFLEEGMMVIVSGLRDFFEGKAFLDVDYNIGGDYRISFVKKKES